MKITLFFVWFENTQNSVWIRNESVSASFKSMGQIYPQKPPRNLFCSPQKVLRHFDRISVGFFSSDNRGQWSVLNPYTSFSAVCFVISIKQRQDLSSVFSRFCTVLGFRAWFSAADAFSVEAILLSMIAAFRCAVFSVVLCLKGPRRIFGLQSFCFSDGRFTVAFLFVQWCAWNIFLIP